MSRIINFGRFGGILAYPKIFLPYKYRHENIQKLTKLYSKNVSMILQIQNYGTLKTNFSLLSDPNIQGSSSPRGLMEFVILDFEGHSIQVSY